MHILVFSLWTLVTFNIYLLAGSFELYMINPPWVWPDDGIQLLALNSNAYFLLCLILNLFKEPLGGAPNLIAQFTYQIVYGTEFGWDCFATSLLCASHISIQWQNENINASNSAIMRNLMSKTAFYLVCFYLIRILGWPLEIILNDLFSSNRLSQIGLIDLSFWNSLLNSFPREFLEALCAIFIGYIIIVFRKIGRVSR